MVSWWCTLMFILGTPYFSYGPELPSPTWHHRILKFATVFFFERKKSEQKLQHHQASKIGTLGVCQVHSPPLFPSTRILQRFVNPVGIHPCRGRAGGDIYEHRAFRCTSYIARKIKSLGCRHFTCLDQQMHSNKRETHNL